MAADDETTIRASEILDAIRKLQARVPGFQHLTNDQVISIRKVSALHPDWVSRAVSILDASPAMASAVGTTHDALVAEITESAEWSAVETELKVLLKGVAAANLLRRHRIGLKALQIYGISRQLIRQPEHSDLRPFVEQLQQMNKLGKRKKKDQGEAR